ncbi:MAG: sugar transferase [Lachnospiraceae bacterium]
MDQIIKKNQLIELYLILAVDIVVIIVSYFISYRIRYGQLVGFQNDTIHQLAVMCIVLSCVVYSLFMDWKNEFCKRGYLVEMIAITKYNFVILMVTAVLLFFLRQVEFFSRLVFLYFFISNQILTFIAHTISKVALRKYFQSNHSIIQLLVIAKKDTAKKTIQNLKQVLPLNYCIFGIVLWDDQEEIKEIEGVPIIAHKVKVIETVKSLPLDEVFIDHLPEQREEAVSLIDQFKAMGVLCHYNIELTEWNKKESKIETFGNYTVISYAINYPDFRRLIIKRMIDILGGIVGLLISVFIVPFAAIAIKIESKGPVFFKQTRIGKNGRRFKIYKLRSMYIDAEERKKELLKLNEMDGHMFKMKNDPRITKVGNFIRKTSIDELPQFYNIIKGEMSLVGTRPPTEDEFKEYDIYYKRRLCMTPGLTGLWQVSGRSDIQSFDEVVKLDLEYIDNWCLELDIKIIIQTIGVVLFRKGSR